MPKIIHEELYRNFTEEGIKRAAKIIQKEKNTLFDDIIKNIENSKELWHTVYDLLILGEEKTYNVYAYETGIMYGIFRENKQGKLVVFNRIFENLIYEYMITKRSEEKGEVLTYNYRSNFIKENGDLNFQHILEKFQDFMYKEYRETDEKFIEKEGRLLFLSFVRPIINGVGFYYVEAETRLDNRMDVVITYNKKQYIVELKIWHGEKQENKGLDQLAKYLRVQGEDRGYMLIFNFNKNKVYQKQWIDIGKKKIYEVIV